MGFETGMNTYLRANVPLVNNRVHPDTLPQGTSLPAITYRRLAGIPEYHHGGSSDLEDGRYEVNIWASTPLERLNVYAELRAACSGVKTSFGDKPATSFIRNHFSVYEPETGKFREIVEMRIWHKESA